MRLGVMRSPELSYFNPLYPQGGRSPSTLKERRKNQIERTGTIVSNNLLPGGHDPVYNRKSLMPDTPNADLGNNQTPLSPMKPSPLKPAEAGPRLRPALGVWLRDLILSLAISAFIIVFIYQPVKVEGTSMMPSLDDQERIFVNKFVYRLEPIERGDVVGFRYPRDPSKSYIKRVIGVAGDRIRIDGGQVYVNDEAL